MLMAKLMLVESLAVSRQRARHHDHATIHRAGGIRQRTFDQRPLDAPIVVRELPIFALFGQIAVPRAGFMVSSVIRLLGLSGSNEGSGSGDGAAAGRKTASAAFGLVRSRLIAHPCDRLARPDSCFHQ